jgi:heat shock protein HtpX
MGAYGLYTHIASNKTRSILLLVGLFLLIYVIVFAGAIFLEVFLHSDRSVDYYLRVAFADVKMAFPYATVAAAAWIIIAYFFNVSIIDAVTGATDVTRKEQPRLYNLLENLCISRGIPMPKLKVMDTEALNAFASGLNQRQYAVTVTSGLLKELNDEEMEAVLGHELTHIRNGDVQLMVIAVIIAGVVGFAAEIFFRIFFNSNWSFGGGSSRSSSSSSSDSDRKGGGGAIMAILIAVALIVVAWFLSLVVRFALSRSREFLADAGAVELTKNPDAMISALRKIENRGELEGATSAVMEMCIDNPREGFTDLFATHPSVDARIRALVKFAGGHDQGRIARPEDTETDLSDETKTDETAPDAAAPQGELPPPQPGLPPQAPAPQPQPRRSPWGALKPAIPFGRRDG